MSQTRINIYGSTIETGDIPTMIANIMSPGRMEGNDFKVLGADLLGISPGSCLMPDGVLVIEDEEKQLVVPNSSSSVDYTIAYQLEDSRVLGGSPAVLRLISGVYHQEDFSDATIIGWIRYSGGSQPIADSMFVQPSSLKIVPQDKQLSFNVIAPFPTAIRPSTAISGSNAVVSVPLANGQLAQTFSKAFGSRVRIISASVMSDFGIVSNQTSYLTYSVKNGTVVLFSLDTRYGSLLPDVPASLTKNNLATLDKFIFDVGDATTIDVQRAGVPSPTLVGDITTSPLMFTKTGGLAYAFGPTDLLKYMFFRSGANAGAIAQIVEVTSTTQVKLKEMGLSFISSTGDAVELQNAGEIVLTVENPASSGRWRETITTSSGESVSRFDNISQTTETYLLQFPFIIESSGQPRKLVTRLLVDFNCIVTLRLRVAGTPITLSPAGGVVSNTGTLITSEMDIPVTSTVWNPGSTGVIEAEINAQAGRGASFAFFALVQEPTPFRIFTT
jgi:hypothetical protein